MKNYIYYTLLLFLFSACVKQSDMPDGHASYRVEASKKIHFESLSLLNPKGLYLVNDSLLVVLNEDKQGALALVDFKNGKLIDVKAPQGAGPGELEGNVPFDVVSLVGNVLKVYDLYLYKIHTFDVSAQQIKYVATDIIELPNELKKQIVQSSIYGPRPFYYLGNDRFVGGYYYKELGKEIFDAQLMRFEFNASSVITNHKTILPFPAKPKKTSPYYHNEIHASASAVNYKHKKIVVAYAQLDKIVSLDFDGNVLHAVENKAYNTKRISKEMENNPIVRTAVYSSDDYVVTIGLFMTEDEVMQRMESGAQYVQTIEVFDHNLKLLKKFSSKEIITNIVFEPNNSVLIGFNEFDPEVLYFYPIVI